MKLTEDEAQAMLDQLSEHYGVRVAKVSDVCNALYEWARIMRESGYLPEIDKALGPLHIPLMKSNLAHRLVYLGEPVRTEPCPIHKGHWSGCVFFEDACPHCMSGSNVTGWCAPEGGAKPDTNPTIIPVVLKSDGTVEKS